MSRFIWILVAGNFFMIANTQNCTSKSYFIALSCLRSLGYWPLSAYSALLWASGGTVLFCTHFGPVHPHQPQDTECRKRFPILISRRNRVLFPTFWKPGGVNHGYLPFLQVWGQDALTSNENYVKTVRAFYFAATGYDTYMAGKWHVGYSRVDNTPIGRGNIEWFDFWYRTMDIEGTSAWSVGK